MAPQGLPYGCQFCRAKALKPCVCNGGSVRVYMYTDGGYLQNTRMGRGSVTFFEYPKYSLALSRPVELSKGYPIHVKTIGEHIRKRRLDLGLLQIEIAAMIGVTESTVWNWEHGTEPELIHIPKVIEFLGYVPFECPEEAVEKLRYFKKVKGLSYERLGALIKKDPEQLIDWLSGKRKPCKKNFQNIERFLKQMD